MAIGRTLTPCALSLIDKNVVIFFLCSGGFETVFDKVRIVFEDYE